MTSRSSSGGVHLKDHADGRRDLDPHPGTSSQRLLAVAGAANQGPFECRAVGTRVNRARYNDAELLAPLNT